MHLALFLRVAQIHILQIASILFAPLLAEDEIDDRKELGFLEMVDKVGPSVLVKIEGSPCARTESAASTSDRSRRGGRSAIDTATTVDVTPPSTSLGERSWPTGRQIFGSSRRSTSASRTNDGR